MLEKPLNHAEVCPLIKRVFRTDLYREAARHLGLESPSMDSKTEGTQKTIHRFERNIELGPDLILDNGQFDPVCAY